MRKRLISLVAATLAVGLALLNSPTQAEEPAKPSKPIVQIALLLDTSGSMQGLIDQAKTQLWKIVTEFAKTSRDGVRPEIEVALYHYGTPSLGRENNYIKQLAPLTTDLDKISEELFKLKTSGGDEYCGAVIRQAATELKWSADKRAYKAIFIAGNEPFTQGPVKYQDACKEAITKGIIVNTIHCGKLDEGARGEWDQGAKLADGTYVAIDQNKPVVHIDAPQDKEIATLGEKLNKTYIGYGAAGPEALKRQNEQDLNAKAAAPAVAAQRAEAKASAAYSNSTWDLVDAAKKDEKALEKIAEADLPEEMKKLDPAGRKAYVEAKAKERAEIQKKIGELSAERSKYVAEKQKEATGDKTLDTAIIETVRTQARKVDLTIEEKK